MLGEHTDAFEAANARFEVDAGAGEVFTDCVVSLAGDDLYLEFHHISPANCTAARIAAYIMGKLQTYALHYNLIPR